MVGYVVVWVDVVDIVVVGVVVCGVVVVVVAGGSVNLGETVVVDWLQHCTVGGSG